MKKRLIVFAVVLVMIGSIVQSYATGILEIDPPAGYNDATEKARNNAVIWAQNQVGVSLDYDSAYGAQCVDLIYYYYRYLGYAPLGGSACDYIWNTQPSAMERITGSLVPQPGDIAVWKTNHSCNTCQTTEDGHVGIVISADTSQFTAVNQRFNNTLNCTVNTFNTSALACVIRPSFELIGNPSITWEADPNTAAVYDGNAVLANICNFSGVTNLSCTEVGIFLYDNNDKLLAEKRESTAGANINGESYLKISYNVKNELGYTLTNGIKYRYKFMAVVNGETYYSRVYNFDTYGTHSHKYNNGEITTKATCKVEGVKTYTCTTKDCNATKTETIIKTEHKWDSGVVTTAPTCKDKGVKTYTCSICKDAKTESVAATGVHTPGEWAVQQKENCKTTGIKVQKCKTCGVELKSESIPKAEHKWDNGTIVKEATCVSSGTKSLKCDGCGTKRNEEIPATGIHRDGEWEIESAATCTANGEKVKKCVDCGAVTEKKTVGSSGHMWDNGSTTKEPTCNADGVKTYNCFNCDETKTEAISATGVHSYGEWEKHNGTEHKQVCSSCGGIKTGAHSWGEAVLTSQPTADKEGVTTYTCKVCKATKSGSVPTVHTHSFDEKWIYDGEYHWKICSCGQLSEKNTHNHGTPATETTAQICTVCEKVIVPPIGHTHSFGEAWNYDDTYHWVECSCTEKDKNSEHIWDTGKTTSENNGKIQKIYSCELCEATKTEYVEKDAESESTDAPIEERQPVSEGGKEDKSDNLVTYLFIACGVLVVVNIFAIGSIIKRRK